ncbi:MAG: cytochrome c [Pseudohongiellaceae bacterium]|nr:cytochrome c [Pseudomonadota bacterium]
MLLLIDSLKLRAMRIADPLFTINLILTTLISTLLPLKILAAEEKGERLFLDNCAECHQVDGKGIPGIYPALDANEVVSGSGVDVALVLIIGRGEMPSFRGSILPEEMAAVINYVRNAWSNSGELILAGTIESLQ